LWLIDHGASLYFHHNWVNWKTYLSRAFPKIKDHVLLERANHLKDAAKEIQDSICATKIDEIISLIPEDWLIEESNTLSTDAMIAAYNEFLNTQLNKIDLLSKEAADAK